MSQSTTPRGHEARPCRGHPLNRLHKYQAISTSDLSLLCQLARRQRRTTIFHRHHIVAMGVRPESKGLLEDMGDRPVCRSHLGMARYQGLSRPHYHGGPGPSRLPCSTITPFLQHAMAFHGRVPRQHLTRQVYQARPHHDVEVHFNQCRTGNSQPVSLRRPRPGKPSQTATTSRLCRVWHRHYPRARELICRCERGTLSPSSTSTTQVQLLLGYYPKQAWELAHLGVVASSTQ